MARPCCGCSPRPCVATVAAQVEQYRKRWQGPHLLLLMLQAHTRGSGAQLVLPEHKAGGLGVTKYKVLVHARVHLGMAWYGR